MSQQKVEIVQESSKPVAEMFAALADHNNLRRVFGVPVSRIRDAEGDDVNGVGSVRRIGGPGPLGIEETVTALQANRSISYRISRGGGPVRNHSGKIAFAEVGGGSRVTWTIRFDSPLPLLGPVVARVLDTAIRIGLRRIA
jgi:hypothetical protein